MVSPSFKYLSLLSLVLPSIVASPAADLETRATSAQLPSSLQNCLKNTKAELSYPSDSSYGDYSAPENSALKASPAVIVLPKHASVAAKVVKCVANENGNVKLSPRGGGHSYEAYSTPNGAVTLDLRKLNEINVNKDAKTAEVGAGVRLGDLAAQLADQGFALPMGTCPYVGVSGHGLGGGFGFLARDSGYLMDRILSMSMVKADGSVVTASKTENPDLYWGLLGAGSNNFGTVLSFTYSLVDAPSQTVNFNYVFNSNDDCANTLVALQSLTNSADPSVGFPPELTGELLLYGAGEGDPGACSFQGQHVRATESQHASVFSRLTKKSGIKPSSSTVTSYTTWKDSLLNIMGSFDTSDVNGNHEPYYAKSLVTPQDAVFTSESAKALMDKLVSYIGLEGTGNSISFEMLGPLSYTNKVPKEATSFPHRSATFISQYYSYGFPSSNSNGQQDKIYNAFQDLVDTAKKSSPNSTWGAYSNYIDAKLSTWAKDYYGDSLDRLKALKKTWDPATIFDFPRGLAHA